MTGAVKIIATVAILAGLVWAFVNFVGFDEIEYQGQKFKLRKKYRDFDAYKNDSKNLEAFELPRIEKMIAEAPVGREFADWPAFAAVVGPLMFPGYGSGGGPQVTAAGRKFVVYFVEIPTRPPGEKSRYFVLEKYSGERLRLVDDFVSPGWPILAHVELRDEVLTYASKDGTIIRRTRLSTPAEPVDPDQRP